MGETSDCSEIEIMISAIAEQSRKNATELAEVKESLATMKERHMALCEYVLDMKIDQRDIRKAALDSLAILKLQETRVQEISPSPPPRRYDPDRINDLLSSTRFPLTENTISHQSNNFSNTRISNIDSTLHSGVRVRREYTLNSKITYADWLKHLKSELEHYDLIDFIDPEINLGDDPNVKKSRSIVQSLIISRVDKSYQSKLINIKNPHELLSKIQEIRKVKNNLNVYSLKKDIYNITMKKNESANDFCNRFDNMLKLYDSCDPKDKFTEYDKAPAFYNATQERCTELRSLVKLRKLNNENELTIEEMKSCLLQDEIDKAAKVTPPPAARAAGPTQAGGEPSKCHRCEQKGHLAPDCPLGPYKLWYCYGSKNFTQSKKRQQFQGNCRSCGKRGHKQRDCWNNKQDKERPSHQNKNTDEGNALIGTVLTSRSCATNEDCSENWLLDSGASQHMTHHRDWFSTFTSFQNKVPIRLGDGHILYAAGKVMPITPMIIFRENRSGYVLKLGNSVIIWGSRKQSTVALSTTESEFMAACLAVQEIIWVKSLLQDMIIHTLKNPILYIDNLSTIHLIKDQRYHCRTKHIDVKYKFIRSHYNETRARVASCMCVRVCVFVPSSSGASSFAFVCAARGAVCDLTKSRCNGHSKRSNSNVTPLLP
ncbi:unnamed protein product [Trichogramma brassicae]|uniref:CCHC-type domain-containing protein n=1 Tax=Trichogramma brassicae TaxID=86971 RepID=A0A6H5J018_9HYME|nr:unnamed protein product [Trichogramma brassicae]